MNNYWDENGKRYDKSHKWQTLWAVIGTITLLAMLCYACALGYIAMAEEFNRYNDLRDNRSKRSAMMKMQAPVKFSLPEHYLAMTGERGAISQEQ